MAPIAFTDGQLEQVRTTAAQVPRWQRAAYLQRIVELLGGRDFGDGDVHRAARAAAAAVMHGLDKTRRGADPVVDGRT